jgi:hypothetical protein
MPLREHVEQTSAEEVLAVIFVGRRRVVSKSVRTVCELCNLSGPQRECFAVVTGFAASFKVVAVVGVAHRPRQSASGAAADVQSLQSSCFNMGTSGNVGVQLGWYSTRAVHKCSAPNAALAACHPKTPSRSPTLRRTPRASSPKQVRRR